MPQLILLNGPPAVGKSTLAARYADDHPGTLNLDIDLLHPLIGGWRDTSGRTHDIVRPLALAMAGAHLKGGRDVIVPQLLGQSAAIEAFERVARDAGARLRKVVLLAERDDVLNRFKARADRSEWDSFNRDAVAANGGEAWLGELYDRLTSVLPLRPNAVVVRSEPGDPDATYAALLEALD